MYCGLVVWFAFVRILVTELSRAVLIVAFHGLDPRMESFLSLMTRKVAWSACLVLGVSLVRSSTRDSSSAPSCWSVMHMLAVIIGTRRWMPMCLRRWMGSFDGLKNCWSSGRMNLATTCLVVVVKSCSALRMDSGGRWVSVGIAGGVRDPPRWVNLAYISSQDAPGLPGSARFQ